MLEKKLMFKVFITLGIVSLLSDITYEGARSVSGAYLNFLSSPAIAAGLLAIGEVLSYLMRLAGGLIAQKTYSPKIFWSIIYIGYSVNLAIPILALTDQWVTALTLYFVERLGKGLRAPVRDVLLSEVSEGMGKGKGFGIHEVIDQIGAVAGPSILSLQLAYHSEDLGLAFRVGFSMLGIPAVLSMITITYANANYPKPRSIGLEKSGLAIEKLGKKYWVYIMGSAAAVTGLLYWGFISYYLLDLARVNIIHPSEVAFLYLIAMAADAVIALPVGILYDKYKSLSLLLTPLTALLTPVFLFTYVHRLSLYIASILWGLAMGGIETVMKASIADMVDYSSRPIAYGIFSTVIGFSMLLSGTMYSYFYQIMRNELIMVITLSLEIVAMIVYTVLIKHENTLRS